MTGTLIVSSCDTGSANALAPVLAHLSCSYLVYAQADAARVFERWGISYYLLGPIDWDDLIAAGNSVLSKVKVKAIVTGTSWGPSIDKALILAAREHDIPCASIVDHWDLYMERFSILKNGQILVPGKFLPNRIWVNDAIAHSEATSAGLPVEAFDIVGQPHLEHQMKLFRKMRDETREKKIVFVSERVGEDFVQGSPLYRGFDEFKVLGDLLDLADTLGLQILIKLHPQEREDKYDDLVSGKNNVEVVKEADNVKLIVTAGKLVGMFSMLLLEAALVRSDVISYLPSGDPSLFIGNRVGATTPATTKMELQALLAKPSAESSRHNTSFGRRFEGSSTRMSEAIGMLVR